VHASENRRLPAAQALSFMVLTRTGLNLCLYTTAISLIVQMRQALRLLAMPPA
jgi:hypothetical protein